MTIDRTRLEAALDHERATHEQRNPTSIDFYKSADNLFGRVPMTWMNKWAGGTPMYLASAHGNRITDVDGNTYIDFALGDTGAMAGHSPPATVAALARRAGELGGITTMLPTEDAQWVAAELTRRFRMPKWSFTLSASDANRWALRIGRMVTGRPKVLAFSYSYHGSVDETFAIVGPDGATTTRPGNVGPPIEIGSTTVAAEFNDLESVEQALAGRDVAVLITEPAMTNIGIVLPEPGFLEGLRDLCDRYGTLLLIDETHTFSAGPGGCTAAWDLRPDIFVIGKSLGGGIPCGAYGLSDDVSRRAFLHTEADLVDVGGVGGTLAGNAVSLAAMRATLGEVLTDDAFGPMIDLGTRFNEGVQRVIDDSGVPWSVSQLGARSEYRFASPAPTNGTEAARSGDEELEEYLHLYLSNRGVLITPFHNMALMCPETTAQDVDTHTELFRSAVAAIA